MKTIHLFLFVFSFVALAQAQSNWKRIDSGLNPFEKVVVVDDTLYGIVANKTTWDIRMFDDNIWKRYKPFPKEEFEWVQSIVKFHGDLYVLTSAHFWRFDGNSWTKLATSSFNKMVVYNDKIVINGSFIYFMGVYAVSFATWDGTSPDALRGLNGQSAYVTGSVYNMKVVGQKLYFMGNLFNTQIGPTKSNTAVWNDTTWSQAFTPLPVPEPVFDMAEWNGELYFSLNQSATSHSGVYKLIGNTLAPVGSLAPGVQMYGTCDPNLVVYNNRLYRTAIVYDATLPQFPKQRKTLLFFDGLNWKDSGDKLYLDHNVSGQRPGLFTYGGELHANQLPVLNNQPFVGKIEAGSASASLSVIDTRDTSCTNPAVTRYLPSLIKVAHPFGTEYYYSSSQGDVVVNIPDSSITEVSMVTNLPYYEQNECADSIITLNTDSNTNHHVAFYQTPPAISQDIEVTLSAFRANRARQGFFDEYFIVATNRGTDTLTNIELDFSFPQASLFHTSTLASTSYGAGYANFNIAQLAPGALKTITVKLHNTTALLLGDTISLTVDAQVLNDVQPANNSSTLNQQVVAAYDPNNKLVDREGIKEWGGDLEYQINFQNLGSDTAYRVVIVDSLSKHVKLATLQIIAASHAMEIEFRKGILYFIFDDILLPHKAANEDLSMGFVRFNVAMADGMDDRDTIVNRAHIFFDFQPAVITNRAKTYKISTAAFVEDEIREREGEIPYVPSPDFSVYPNPSNGNFWVKTEIPRSFVVYSSYGQLITQSSIMGNATAQKIDLSGLPTGIYYLLEQFGSVHKLIITRK